MSKEQPQIFRVEIETKSPDTSDKILESKRIPEGLKVLIRNIFVGDLTTDAKTVRIGFRSKGTIHWIMRRTLGTGVYTLSLTGSIILDSGETVCGMIESPTANDTIILYAFGEYL